MLELAKEAWGENHEVFWFDDDGIERFAALVRAKALEEAAKVCEDYEGTLHQWTDKRKTFAAAIRKLK